ncbi:HAMP domain-containing protein [Nonomuraea sp. NN258]|nr:HAMP domain-containing protein [Nonomuraea antri]
MARPWPLRHRLLAALLGLCAAGLAAFAAAGVLLLDRSLLDRVDDQLAGFAATFAHRPPPPAPPPRPRGGVELPSQYHVAFYDSAGALTRRLPADAADGPALPSRLTAAPGHEDTLPGRSGEGEWRVLVSGLPDGGRVAVSMSLESNLATVRRLLAIEAVAGVLVLALLAAVARAVVRLGLRPLTRMERTAQAIADGDVDRRVGDADPRTETGRLGRALNVMLERLGRALRERERSEQRLRHFVADASHELRTPLTSIRGFAELYQHGQGARDPVVERLLARIEGEAERMGVLVADMLLLARLDQEPALERGTVDLRVLAGDVVQAARARDRERDLRLEISEEPVLVHGDEHRLHQVIANLVGNAMTHTAAGTPVRVTVTGHALAPPSPEGAVTSGTGPAPGLPVAAVEVRDEGAGIAPAHLTHVFDRFYRADPGRSRAHGGTGLGLAIAAALAAAHDGRIEAASPPGRGTTFRVLLPAHT